MYIATLRSVFVVIVCIALAHLSPQSKHAGDPNSAVKGVLTWTSATLAEQQANGAGYPLRDGYFGELHLHTIHLFAPRIFGDTINDSLTVQRFAKGKVVTLTGDMCGEDGKAFAEAVASLWARIKQTVAQNYEPDKFTSLATSWEYRSPDLRDSRWRDRQCCLPLGFIKGDGRSVQQRAVQSMLILEGKTAPAQDPFPSPCTVSVMGQAMRLSAYSGT